MSDTEFSAPTETTTVIKQQVIDLAEPSLGVAGGGLPKVEGWLLRYFFVPFFTAITPRRFAVWAFRSEGDKALALAQNAPHEHLSRRMLIPRLIAMEDSSRYWSVYMALRHLILVGEIVEDIVIKSSHGQQSTKTLSIVAVKPEVGTPATVVDDFRHFLERFDRRMASEVGDHHAKVTHVHPWLGPITMHQWLCLGGVHQRLHRRQIEMILRKVKNDEV